MKAFLFVFKEGGLWTAALWLPPFTGRTFHRHKTRFTSKQKALAFARVKSTLAERKSGIETQIIEADPREAPPAGLTLEDTHA